MRGEVSNKSKQYYRAHFSSSCVTWLDYFTVGVGIS